jgi:hydroxypyruvate reductase
LIRSSVGSFMADVIGDDPDVIGSGPTAPDASTFTTAREILRKYGVIPR